MHQHCNAKSIGKECRSFCPCNFEFLLVVEKQEYYGFRCLCIHSQNKGRERDVSETHTHTHDQDKEDSSCWRSFLDFFQLLSKNCVLPVAFWLDSFTPSFYFQQHQWQHQYQQQQHNGNRISRFIHFFLFNVSNLNCFFFSLKYLLMVYILLNVYIQVQHLIQFESIVSIFSEMNSSKKYMDFG